jgi:hypothetical protein
MYVFGYKDSGRCKMKDLGIDNSLGNSTTYTDSTYKSGNPGKHSHTCRSGFCQNTQEINLKVT